MACKKRASSRKEQYLKLGLELLADDGPKALNTVRITRELNVTTGSFYWHFDSVADFHNAVRAYWADVFLPELVAEARASADGDPTQALSRLSTLVRESGAHRYDDAMRRWAFSDARTAQAVTKMDRWRMAQLKEMMGASEAATAYADVIGATWRGTTGMKDSRKRLKIVSTATQGVR